jgi:hypothetical protein
MRFALAALGLSVLAVGCGHVDTYEAMLRPAERPTGRPVELYMADQPMPARPFYEIALVQAIGFGSDAHPEDVANALVEKAARLGCDAVVRTFIDQGYSRAHASGVCVRWTGAGPAAPASGLPEDAEKTRPQVRPSPAPRVESLPSAGPQGGGGR